MNSKRKSPRDDQLHATVGTRLRALRESAGLSQGSLGQLIGVSTQQVSKYEKGDNDLSYEGLIIVSQYFGITIDALLDNDVSSFSSISIDYRNILISRSNSLRELVADLAMLISRVDMSLPDIPNNKQPKAPAGRKSRAIARRASPLKLEH